MTRYGYPALPNDPELYSLLLVGLSVLHRSSEEVVARKANAVFRAWRGAYLFHEDDRRAIPQRKGLMGLVVRNCTFRYQNEPPAEQLLVLVGSTPTHLLAYLPPPKPGKKGGTPVKQQLDFVRLVGPRGHPLIITDAGLAEADRVAAELGDKVSPEIFMSGWDVHLREVKAWARAIRRHRVTP